MPVRFRGCGEGPQNRVPAETSLYLRITGDITWIIKVDELVSTCLPEYRSCNCQQRKAD